MNRQHALISLLLATLVGGCDFPDASIQTEELEEKVAALKEARPPSHDSDDVLKAELAEAREQLQAAMVALELEQKARMIEESPVDETVSDEDVDVEGAPRAVVVEEEEGFAEGTESLVALKEGGEVGLEPRDHQVFFTELSKFGDWFETIEFGFVWQPSVLESDPAWRPYTRGRWVHSEQGWTWLSDEPFGWAVYHYGRWALLDQYGWVWIPGDDWAPAWVAWRQNDDYLGWAPLPPETLYQDDFAYDAGIDADYGIAPDYYSFVPADYFYEPVYPYFVPQHQVTQIVFSSVNVTRIRTRGNRVHCGGPDLAWVNRRAGKQMGTCRLNFDGHHDHERAGRHNRLRGDRLDVYAPKVAAPWNPAIRPPRVAGHLGRVGVKRKGVAVDSAARQRHQRSFIERQRAARTALETKDGHRALRHNVEERREAVRERRVAGRSQEGPQREQAEAALRNAVTMAESTQRTLEKPNLNPKQQAYARLAASRAADALRKARAAHAANLAASSQPPVERRRRPAPAPRQPNSAREARQEQQEPSRRVGRDRAAIVERSSERNAPDREREARIRSERERMVAAERERVRTADQARAEEAAAAERQRVARAQADRERVRRDAEAAERSEQPSRSQAAARNLNPRQRRYAELASRNEERDRQAAEEARRAAAATKARQVEAAQERAREEARQAQVLRQRQAEEEARRQAEAQAAAKAAAAKRAEESRQRAALAERAERQRQASLRAQQEAEAKRQAEEARRQALVRQQAENARRAAAERKQALAEQRRAAAESQRIAQERARADAARQSRLAQQQAERAAAQQRAAEASARRQQEAQRQAASEAAARRAQEARERAEAARQKQAQQQKQRQESPRQQQLPQRLRYRRR